MKFFNLKKIDFKNLSNIERFFSLAITCKPNLFDNEIKSLYYRIGDKKIWEFACNEKCQSIVARTLQKVNIEEKLNSKWFCAAEEMKNNIELYMTELDKLAVKLKQSNIEILALKNTGIARGIYRDYASSPMGDIDVLVKPLNFFKAHKCLIQLGYTFSDRSPFKISDINQAFEHGGAEYICSLANGNKLWIELQCRSVAGRWIQPNQEPSPDQLFNNSVPIEGSFCRLLSPEDNLLQVCLHTAKHSFIRSPGFRLHTDVDRIVGFYNIKWDDFCKKVELLNVKTPVFLSLLIPKMLLRSDIPDYVLDRLNYFPFKTLILQSWLINVGLFGPEEKKWSKLGYIFFNIFLFDNLKDLIRAIFPERKNLLIKSKTNKSILFFYLKRIYNLIFDRSKNI